MIGALITQGLGYAVKWLITRGLGIGSAAAVGPVRELVGLDFGERSLAVLDFSVRNFGELDMAVRDMEISP